MKTTRINNSGAASMIVVIFVSIMLTILVLGFIRLAVNEQRVATDDDLTTRAYFAAESGVEDAKRAIREFQNGSLTELELNADECGVPIGGNYDPELSPPTDYDVEYTCQLIELRPETFEHHFDGANQTVQVPINPVDIDGNPMNFNRMDISWHVNADPASDGDGVVQGGGIQARTGVPSQPDRANWLASRFPAMLRVNIFSHPQGNFTSGDVESTTFFLNPFLNGNENVTVNHFSGPNVDDGAMIAADCDGNILENNGDYFCTVQITPFSNTANTQYYLRVTSLYRDTHMRAQISNGANVAYFDDIQAVVDVTGRAGGVFRRVETRLDLSLPSLLPDAAITSLEDICKDFTITDVASTSDFDGWIDSVNNIGTSCTIPD